VNLINLKTFLEMGIFEEVEENGIFDWFLKFVSNRTRDEFEITTINHTNLVSLIRF